LAVAELSRVCKPGGTLHIVEPNGLNPLIRILALLRPHERGLLRNTPASLRSLVATHFSNYQIESRQPMPIYRLLLHYQFGLAQLGMWRVVRILMRGWDRALGKLLPRRWWAYTVITVEL